MDVAVLTPLAERFEDIKRHFRLNNSRLAKLAGCSHQAINNIVNGVTDNPKIETLRNIAQELGISFEWLINGQGQMLKNGLEVTPVNDDATVDFFRRIIEEKDKIIFEKDRQLLEKDKMISHLRNRLGKRKGVFIQASLFPSA